MKIDLKKLFISIIIPLISGTIIGLLTAGFNNYSNLNSPAFAPPGFVFPIVWSILYILMGISEYIIIESKSYYKRKALFIYKVQLITNLLWSIIFFVLKLRTLAFIWIILLIILVIIMINNFYKIAKKAALIQIPYLLWLVFAAILNFSIIILN